MIFARKNLPFCLLVLIIIAQALISLCYSITLHYELKTSALDGALFQQVLTNFINGNGLVTTIHYTSVEKHWLGVHFSPIIYAISPIYWLFPHIETLLFLQSFCIALAAMPLFFIAKKLLKSNWQALLISIFYLINPFVINAQIWDFHEIAFAPLTISLMLWAVLAKKRGWIVFFCVVLLSIKEHYGLAVFGTGLLWAWHHKDYKFGFILAAFGLIAFWLVLKVIMPSFNPNLAAAMLGGNPELDRFSWITYPLSEIYPDYVLNIIKRDSIYFVMLFFPFLLILPFLSFAWLLPAGADIVVNSLSAADFMSHPNSYHSAAVIAIIIVAYVYSISKHCTENTHFKRVEVLSLTLIVAFFFSYSRVALPYFLNNFWEFEKPKLSLFVDEQNSVNEIAKIIGSEAKVSAQINVLPALPVRQQMYVFPQKIDGMDYIVLNTSFPYKIRPHGFGVPYEPSKDGITKETADIYFEKTDELLKNKKWGVVYYQNNWLVIKNGAAGDNNLRAAARQDLHDLEERYTEICRLWKINNPD